MLRRFRDLSIHPSVISTEIWGRVFTVFSNVVEFNSRPSIITKVKVDEENSTIKFTGVFSELQVNAIATLIQVGRYDPLFVEDQIVLTLYEYLTLFRVSVSLADPSLLEVLTNAILTKSKSSFINWIIYKFEVRHKIKNYPVVKLSDGLFFLPTCNEDELILEEPKVMDGIRFGVYQGKIGFFLPISSNLFWCWALNMTRSVSDFTEIE